MKKYILMILLTGVFANGFCAEKKLTVTVSIVPQKYFVKKIAGENVAVNVMVVKGASPATYEPKPSQMLKLVKSDIYFSIGVPFEKSWLHKFKSVAKNTVFSETQEGIELREISKHTHHGEEHGHEHDDHGHKDEHVENHKHDNDDHGHDHGGMKDPHVWLSPRLAKVQAENILKVLVKADKKNTVEYKENYEKFIKEIEILDKKIKEVFKKSDTKSFMVFHPSWGYFSDDYGLEQIAVEIDGKEPSAKEMAELIKEAKEEHIKAVFIQPQFSRKAAKTIAKQLGAKVLVADSLSEDWADNLLELAEIIAGGH